MKLKSLIFGLVAVSGVCLAAPEPREMGQDLLQNEGLKINHWILAKPNGNPITVMDLAKRLSVAFHQQYPEYIHNSEIRYQFYTSQWRYILNDLINNELILADADEKKIEVNDGEVRKELEQLFGPNVVETIDEIGLSWDEALEIVKTDLIVNRMQGFMVSRRAMSSVTPDQMQQAFDQYLLDHPPEDEWKYQVLSLRHPSVAIAESAAITASSLLKQGLSLDELKGTLEKKQKDGLLDQRLTIRVGSVETRSTESLGAAYRTSLDKMKAGTYSRPAAEQSRSGQGVARIFHLITYTEGTPPSFADMETELQGQLFQTAAIDEQQKYITKLRSHYGIDDDYLKEMIPTGFQPFSVY